ncbi:polyprenyl synthetase family protein [soil metagenome]
MKEELQTFTDLINKEIENLPLHGNPEELYEPIRYILQLGGKRLRPLLALLAYSLYKENPIDIIKPAVAVEVFHNFTLMHDDIMDQAPLRRGKATVHQKWNNNIAILSGDVMMVKVYELLLEIDSPLLKKILCEFNKCASEVCEGQQLDMNFEEISFVSEDEYLHMINLKTAVLLGFSLQMGAMLGGADESSCKLLYEFGKNMGIGFQLKDDLLDVYADNSKFGKLLGGDIIANKKTFLLIKALQEARGQEKNELETWLQKNQFEPNEKVAAIKNIYDNLQVKEITENRVQEYFSKSLKSLQLLKVKEEKKYLLQSFATYLIKREE